MLTHYGILLIRESGSRIERELKRNLNSCPYSAQYNSTGFRQYTVMDKKRKFEVIEKSRLLTDTESMDVMGALCPGQDGHNSCGTTKLYHNCSDETGTKRICKVGYDVIYCTVKDIHCDEFTSCGVGQNALCIVNLDYATGCSDKTMF